MLDSSVHVARIKRKSANRRQHPQGGFGEARLPGLCGLVGATWPRLCRAQHVVLRQGGRRVAVGQSVLGEKARPRRVHRNVSRMDQGQARRGATCLVRRARTELLVRTRALPRRRLARYLVVIMK
jgi:hypothetical protein